MTPPLSASVLPGLTRDTVIYLAKQLGYEVKEIMIPREMVCVADEVFFTGTAAEITPIRSVDKIQIGSGKRGKITDELQNAFFGMFNFVDPILLLRIRQNRWDPARLMTVFRQFWPDRYLPVF